MPVRVEFSEELFEEICQAIAGSEMGLRKLLQSDDRYPEAKTFLRWVNTSDALRQRYAHAKDQQMDMLAEDIIDISENPNLDANDKRVRIDARKWLLSKLKAKTYGDRIDVTSGGEALPAPPTHIDARIQSIMMTAAQRMALGKQPIDEEAQKLLE